MTLPGKSYNSVLNADLVIADLTGHNPNVFYELAIRHLVGKPFIHMTDKPESVPFDIFALNAIRLDKASYGALRAAEAELASQIRSIKAGGVSFANASAEIYEKLLASAKQDTSEQSKALVEEISMLQRRVAEAEARSGMMSEAARADAVLIKRVRGASCHGGRANGRDEGGVGSGPRVGGQNRAPV